MSQTNGWTLAELLVVLSLLALTLTFAIPSPEPAAAARALAVNAESFAQLLQHGQRRALQLGQHHYVEFNPAAGCAVLSRQPQCDCSSDSCRAQADTLLATQAAVTIANPNFSGQIRALFTPLRGMASAGNVQLENSDGQRLKLVLSRLGRVRICHVGEGALRGYPPCG